MVLSDNVCRSVTGYSYLRFRLAPISLKRKISIIGLTKGSKDGAKTMMSRIHTANPGRVYTDSRIGLFGEKEGMVWEDPLLKPRKDIVYR